MEVKKSPKADLENKRSMFTLIGLVLALGFTYICFEWTQTEVTVPDDFVQDVITDDTEELAPQSTQLDMPKPTTPPPVEKVVQQVINVVEDDVQVDSNIAMDNQDDQASAVEIVNTQIDDTNDDEGEEEIFTIVEKQAGFPGGNAKLMEYLRKELQYPQVAIENNISGRVFVEFVVNKDGSIQDVKVARGVDPVLDQEAIRVVKKMPKWTPAEQRGKPCRSRFTLPVLFKFK